MLAPIIGDKESGSEVKEAVMTVNLHVCIGFKDAKFAF